MQSNITIDYGALTALGRIVGFLVTLAGSVAVTFLVEKTQRVAPPGEFKQARNIAVAATAVFIGLMFVFMAGSEKLVALGTTAAGGVLACGVFFLWNVWSGMQKKNAVRVITYLGTFIVFIVCGCVGLSAAGLLLFVWQTNPVNKTPGGTATVIQTTPGTKPEVGTPSVIQTYGVTVEFAGHRNVTRVGETLAFRASSGQVNFGCEQTVPVRAVWEAPLGATVQGGVRAEWANLDNASARQAAAVVEDGRVIGTGTITGLDLQRLPFGISNCPGGGHGELVITGSYLTRKVNEEPYHSQLQGTVSTSPDAARVVRLTLPANGDVALDQAIVSLISGQQTLDSAQVRFVDGQRGSPQRSAKNLFAAVVEKNEIVITLSRP